MAKNFKFYKSHYTRLQHYLREAHNLQRQLPYFTDGVYWRTFPEPTRRFSGSIPSIFGYLAVALLSLPLDVKLH